MKRNKFLVFSCFCLILTSVQGQWQQGLTVVAPPHKVSEKAFEEINELGAEWIALVPYGFTKKGSSFVQYNLEWQWWGEKKEGLEECIQMAQNQGLRILLKPQIYIQNSWPGELYFKDVSKRNAWEKDYTKFILDFATVAESYCIEQFCIGTEFKLHAKNHPMFWRKLIIEIKKIYSGSLTYSSNWDNYQNIQFWDMLDFIGISAYFPLVNANNPTKSEIMNAWKPIIKKLKNFSEKKNKKLLFTEYGYLSVDKAAWQNWELEVEIKSRAVNQKLQANAIDALLSSYKNLDFWAGGFLWKWFPEGYGHEGYKERDYTPQGKEGELILKSHFIE